jgi:hypothetical protein
MSAFIDNITAVLTGTEKPAYQPLEVKIEQAVIDTSNHIPFSTIQEYEIGVKWSAKVSCESMDKQHLINNVIQEFKEVVYGDLRKRIIDLERAVYAQDHSQALMATREIMREIS